jgi:tripartite-type tricarboxylate transporter receptor subunit TctC
MDSNVNRRAARRSARANICLFIVAFLVALLSSRLGCAEYPERPVTIIVPFVPGGANDIVVRILSEPRTKALGQPVIVENRGGAGGNIGIVAAARARPDGYTILMASSSFAVNPSLYPRVSYDPFTDFMPVADLVFFPCVITVRPDLRLKTLADLIALAKAKPGQLNYSTPGIGTLPHLAAELLKLRANIDIVHVPYAGAGPAVQALIGGTVEIGSMSMSVALPQVTAGTVNALAVTGRDRWRELPDVPTVAEAGFTEAVAETWQGFLVPAGTPRAVVDRLAKDTIAILQRAEIRDKFQQVGFGVVAKGPEALRDRIAEEFSKWKDVIDRTHMKLEP